MDQSMTRLLYCTTSYFISYRSVGQVTSIFLAAFAQLAYFRFSNVLGYHYLPFLPNNCDKL